MSDILEGTLEKIVSTGRNIPLDWGIGTLNAHSAEEVIMMLVERLRKNPKNQKQRDKCSLPRTIYFPYSRHSSLPELCHFVEAFRPLDVWPCTVNNAEWLKNDDGHQQHGSQTTIGPDSVPSSPVRESQGASQKRPVNIDHRFVSPLLETQASIRHGRVVSEAECPKEHLEAPSENSTQQSLVVPTIEQAEDVQQENHIHPESLIDSPSNSPAPVSCRRKRTVSDISAASRDISFLEGSKPLQCGPCICGQRRVFERGTARAWVSFFPVLEVTTIALGAKSLMVVSQWQIRLAISWHQIGLVGCGNGKDSMHDERVLIT
uniref:DNA repair metallo-beta-lactamase domain-containing protein n=1 Tax=Fusarium oxysporum (strain Fo5176) TaxID=660025 RepID=A0A0D2XR00_FUSOF